MCTITHGCKTYTFHFYVMHSSIMDSLQKFLFVILCVVTESSIYPPLTWSWVSNKNVQAFLASHAKHRILLRSFWLQPHTEHCMSQPSLYSLALAVYVWLNFDKGESGVLMVKSLMSGWDQLKLGPYQWSYRQEVQKEMTIASGRLTKACRKVYAVIDPI